MIQTFKSAALLALNPFHSDVTNRICQSPKKNNGNNILWFCFSLAIQKIAIINCLCRLQCHCIDMVEIWTSDTTGRAPKSLKKWLAHFLLAALGEALFRCWKIIKIKLGISDRLMTKLKLQVFSLIYTIAKSVTRRNLGLTWRSQ